MSAGRLNSDMNKKLGSTAWTSLATNTARVGMGAASRNSISPLRYSVCSSAPKLVSSPARNVALVNSTGIARIKSGVTNCATSGRRMTDRIPQLAKTRNPAKTANPNAAKNIPILRRRLARQILFHVMRHRARKSFQT